MTKDQIRKYLINYIIHYIRSTDLTQSNAAKLFGVTQPRMSDLIRKKFHLFSIDALTCMLLNAGFRIDVDCSSNGSGTIRQKHK